MVNPFDKNFFKFFIGFLVILSVSFAIFYVVGVVSGDETGNDFSALVTQ